MLQSTYNPDQNVWDFSCIGNTIQANPPPPWTVLSIRSQTPFTYLAQVKELYFDQGGWGGEETITRPCLRVCVAGKMQTQYKNRWKKKSVPETFSQDCRWDWFFAQWITRARKNTADNFWGETNVWKCHDNNRICNGFNRTLFCWSSCLCTRSIRTQWLVLMGQWSEGSG